MKSIIFVGLGIILLTATQVSASDCPKGETRLNPNEPCIPKPLFNYLYCLQNSGGGRVEVMKKKTSNEKNGIEISLGGKVKLINAAGKFSKTDISSGIDEISEKLDPSLAKICSGYGKVITPAASTKKKKKPEAKKAKSDEEICLGGDVMACERLSDRMGDQCKNNDLQCLRLTQCWLDRAIGLSQLNRAKEQFGHLSPQYLAAKDRLKSIKCEGGQGGGF